MTALSRRTFCLFTAAALATTGCSAAGDGSSQVTTIRVAHNSNAGVLSAQVAAAKGMFAKHGVDVQFTQVENVETLPPALGKSFDIVLSTPTLLISAASRGIDIAEVAGTSLEVPDNPTAAVLTSQDSGITDAGGLRGKKIGILNEAGTLHLATKYWLDQEGIPVDSIEIVQVDPPAGADQLLSGRIDAVETVTPFIDAIQARDGVLLTYPHLEMAPEIGLILWAANGSWAKNNPDAVAGFRAGLSDAVTWIEDPANDSEARDLLQQYTKLPDQIVRTLKLPTYSAAPRPEDHQVWLDAMRKYAGFTGQVDLDTLTVGGAA